MEIPKYPFADVKHIAIIGAGPTGLAALKTIQESPEYKAGLWKPVAFEAKGGVGGIWDPDPGFGNPLYDSLTTNLPHPVMSFSDFLFPPSTPLFPKASVVKTYLEAYAEKFELFINIRLNTPVIDANWDPTQSRWNVVVQPPNSSMLESITVDILFVCNGQHNVPRYPNTPGLSTWLNLADPSQRPLASHSMFYRHPSPGYGETVLVIGGGPSGQDIVADLLTSPLIKKVIHSTTMGALIPPPRDTTGKLVIKPRPSQFLPSTPTKGTVSFVDGTEEHNITHCLLATGYEVSFPFFPTSSESPTQLNLVANGLPPPPLPLPTPSGQLWNTTYGVFPLARHLFPFPPPRPTSSPSYNTELPVKSPTPTLFFVGLPIRARKFLLAESQTRAALAIFRSPKGIDWAEEGVDVITRWEELKRGYRNHTNTPASTHTRMEGTDESEQEETKSIIKRWHRFERMEQFTYLNSLNTLINHLTDTPSPSFSDENPDMHQMKQAVYNLKDIGIMRRAWRSLEASGEAEAWVRGVGGGKGEDALGEWIDAMNRLVELGGRREQEEGGGSYGVQSAQLSALHLDFYF